MTEIFRFFESKTRGTSPLRVSCMHKSDKNSHKKNLRKISKVDGDSKLVESQERSYESGTSRPSFACYVELEEMLGNSIRRMSTQIQRLATPVKSELDKRVSYYSFVYSVHFKTLVISV